MGNCQKKKQKDITTHDPYTFKKRCRYHNKFNIISIIENGLDSQKNSRNFKLWKEKYISDDNYRKEIEGKYLIVTNEDSFNIANNENIEFIENTPMVIFKIIENLKYKDMYSYRTNCDFSRLRVREKIYNFDKN